MGINPTRHGWQGWLPTEIAVPLEALTDRRLRRVVIESAAEAFIEAGNPLQRLRWFLRGLFDPNDWRLVKDNAFGIRYLPLTTKRHSRYGTRERVLDVARCHPDRLTISLNTVATRVLLDDNRRAYGVEVRRGPRLYRAHLTPNPDPGEREIVLRLARGDPGGRHVQFAATADAVRHRASRRPARTPDSRSGSRCPASAGTCRIDTR